jgi:hypothetical protein
MPGAQVDTLVVHLALHEVIGGLPTNSLTIQDARSAARVARLLLAPSFQALPDGVGDPIRRSSVG